MSRRVFAEGSAEVVRSLLGEKPDIVYYCQPGLSYPPDVLVVDYDLVHLNQARTGNRRCAELGRVAGRYGSLVINLPTHVPMAQTQADIDAASTLLGPNGRLVLVMPPKSGHKRVVAMLREAFGRVAVAARRPHVFECRDPRPQPASATVSRIEHYDPSAQAMLSFLTRPGLFSPGKIDGGTRLLLEVSTVLQGCRLLDVGCGYGAVGVTAAARGANVVMLDCDSRAVELASRNLRLNRLPGRTHLAAGLDGLASASFDTCLSNPPAHAGSDVLCSLLRDMLRVCRPTGYTAVVTGRDAGCERMVRDFATAERIAERGGHQVLRLKPRAGRARASE